MLVKFQLPKLENMYFNYLESTMQAWMKIVDGSGNDLTISHVIGIATAPAISAIEAIDVYVGGKLLRSYNMVLAIVPIQLTTTNICFF